MNKRIKHPFEPIYNEESKILILGSFPSVKSREGEFYYHHPRNRFWKLISVLCKEEIPISIQDKKDLLLRNNLAIWDVIKSCEITGSADNTIKNPIVNDIGRILEESKINQILANGGAAFTLYERYLYPLTNQEIIKLPSTSPANAAYSLEKLIDIWGSKIKDMD